MSKTLAWIQACRPLAFANIAPWLLLGVALAYTEHKSFDLFWFMVILSWGALDQLWIVFANDYADREADGLSQTLISGGSGVIPEGKLTPNAIKYAMWGALSALGLFSLSIAYLGRPWVLVGYVIAIALIWAYSFPPLRMSYRGGGEILQGLGVGVALPWFAFYLTTNDWRIPLWCICPAFIMGIASNIASALPDEESDRRANKRTFPVRYGRSRSAAAIALFITLGTTAAAMLSPSLASSQRIVLIAFGLVSIATSFVLGRFRPFMFALGSAASITCIVLLWSFLLI